jgi:hypothetical protein
MAVEVSWIDLRADLEPSPPSTPCTAPSTGHSPPSPRRSCCESVAGRTCVLARVGDHVATAAARTQRSAPHCRPAVPPAGERHPVCPRPSRRADRCARCPHPLDGLVKACRFCCSATAMHLTVFHFATGGKRASPRVGEVSSRSYGGNSAASQGQRLLAPSRAQKVRGAVVRPPRWVPYATAATLRQGRTLSKKRHSGRQPTRARACQHWRPPR